MPVKTLGVKFDAPPLFYLCEDWVFIKLYPTMLFNPKINHSRVFRSSIVLKIGKLFVPDYHNNYCPVNIIPYSRAVEHLQN